MQKVLELIAITKTKGLALSYMTQKKILKKNRSIENHSGKKWSSGICKMVSKGSIPKSPHMVQKIARAPLSKIYDISTVHGMAFVWLLSSASVTNIISGYQSRYHSLPTRSSISWKSTSQLGSLLVKIYLCLKR
jgi:hypothetical protein